MEKETPSLIDYRLLKKIIRNDGKIQTGNR